MDTTLYSDKPGLVAWMRWPITNLAIIGLFPIPTEEIGEVRGWWDNWNRYIFKFKLLNVSLEHRRVTEWLHNRRHKKNVYYITVGCTARKADNSKSVVIHSTLRRSDRQFVQMRSRPNAGHDQATTGPIKEHRQGHYGTGSGSLVATLEYNSFIAGHRGSWFQLEVEEDEKNRPTLRKPFGSHSCAYPRMRSGGP